MQLHELAGVKRFKDMTSGEVVKYFKTFTNGEKVKILGQGANGAAVMIGNTVYKFWMVDSAYTTWVKFCQSSHGNPFLPVFKSSIKAIPAFFLRSPKAPDTINYVKVELLQSDSNIMSTEFKVVNETITLQEIVNIVINLGSSFFKSPKKLFINALNKHLSTKYTVEELSHELKLFMNTLLDIKKLGFPFDLHDGNFMKRGDQLVILDPILSIKDTMLNKSFRAFDQAIRLDDTPELAKPASRSS